MTTADMVLVYLIMAGAFAGVAAIVWLWWYMGKRAAANAGAWPTTKGRVVHSEVTVRRGAKGSRWYEADVRYEFTVGGQPYVGRRIDLGMKHSSSLKKAQERLAPYPIGQDVTVYYDPQKPQKCALAVGVGAEHNTLLITAIIILVIGLVLPVIILVLASQQ